jgi:hypothetical protein
MIQGMELLFSGQVRIGFWSMLTPFEVIRDEILEHAAPPEGGF